MADKDKFELFISYDQRDVAGWSFALYDYLTARFGEGVVFRDKQSIRSGERWKSSLIRQVKGCRGLILVIGRGWQEQRVLDKLHDPKGWVRKEVATALEQRIEIFPVLVDGAVAPDLDKLPEEIRSALDEANHFHFHAGATWQHELDRLCADIEARTGLVRLASTPPPPIKLYDRVLARLDRNPQAADLRRAFSQGGHAFLVTGIKKSGFRHFAIRCALDILTVAGSRNIDDAQRVVALNWGRFSDLPSADERYRALLRDVAENLLTTSGAQDARQLLESIARAVGQTRRPTVVYSTVMAGGRIDTGLAEEWFDTWRDIFRAGAPRLVITILFVENDWWSISAGVPRGITACDARVRPTLGAIRRRDVNAWVESDLCNSAEASLCNKIKHQCKRLFFLRRRRSFEDVGEAVIETWSGA